jgi:hypothetical protein
MGPARVENEGRGAIPSPGQKDRPVRDLRAPARFYPRAILVTGAPEPESFP